MADDPLVLQQYLPRLVIQVVWHPAFQRGQEFANRIYAHFSRDPQRPGTPGIGIPVFFRSAPQTGAKVPAPIAIEDAQHTAVVALVEQEMVDADGWDAYLEALWEEIGAEPERHRLFPVALDATAYSLSAKIGEVNYIRLQGATPEAAPGLLLNRLANDLARLLTQRPAVAAVERHASPAASPPKMRLFLSHAKRDGEKTALALRDYIHNHLALDTFFDTIDIAAGFRFAEEIDAGIDTSAFALVHTDAYASRIWCQHEIIRAKRHGRPVVVIHAIEEGEARSFPYLGNVPTIRWRAEEPARIAIVVGLMLREVLRAEYFQRHFEDLKPLFGVAAEVRALPRAPELLTCLALRQESTQVPLFVYPDPPIARQELELLTELDPHLRLTTPTLLFARPARSAVLTSGSLEKVAAGWRIGLSISDSHDLALRGFGAAHLSDAATEFARFLLAAGATLAYGGDLRQGGFTEVLFELLTAYRAMTGEEADAIQSYLAWPLHLDLTKTQRAELKPIARFHLVPPPADLGIDCASIASSKSFPPTTPENRVAWARSLTAMREKMNAEIHARLLLGGQTRGLGKYPGLAEEALLALRAAKPVFLIGGFGGCAAAVIEALLGCPPAALTLEFQQTDPVTGKENAVAAEAIKQYNAKLAPGAEPINYQALTAEFKKIGVAGLRNGLEPEENKRLFTTTHLPEMIALVLRGLGRLGLPPALGT